MAERFTSYIVENDEAFAQALDRLAATVTDFRIPFGLIAKDFYQGNKRMFSLKTEGRYPPLGGFNHNKTVKYGGLDVSKGELAEEKKKREVGFAYPLLVREGRLASFLIDPSDPETVRIITSKSLTLGTSVPYAIYHQSDKPRKKIPQRKVIFIDGGPEDRGSGRREAWLNILNSYVLTAIEEANS